MRFGKVYKLLSLGVRPRVLRRLVTLCTEGYLVDSGWLRSLQDDRIVDKNGLSVPWTTLPYIDFVEPRLKPTLTMFEFGAGASSFFYGCRVKTLATVENDPVFAEEIRPSLPGNVTLLVREAGTDAYCQSISTCGFSPDIVSVDGRDRVACIKSALNCMSASGVLVLDDAERSNYAEGINLLKKSGFRTLEFWGVAPALTGKKCTTVFYRRDNVFEI